MSIACSIRSNQIWFIFNNFENLCPKNPHEIQQKVLKFCNIKFHYRCVVWDMLNTLQETARL